MEIKNIHINNKRYLSEELNELPSNVLLNKGVTGCGGTHLELISKRNSIILVPGIELAKNKSKPEYLIIHGGVTNKTIEDYLSNDNILYKKIIGTYDCLKRLLEDRDYLLSEYFLLIDEYHILFNSYSFRNDPILYILKKYNRFKHFCFMTATPLDDDIILDEINNLDRINYIWDNAIKIKLNLIDTSFTNKELVKLIMKEEEDTEINYHIFLNSLKTIKDIVTKTRLENYKVVCSETARKNNKTLNMGSTLDSPCKFNFYTATAFEGCDIYDPIGKTIILCDTSISTTILDISTLVRQICGRLRDSIYKDDVTLILNTTKHRYAAIPLQIFKCKVSENVEVGKLTEYEFLHNENPLYKQKELKSYSPEKYNSFYTNKFNDVIFYDDNLRKMDEYNYKLISSIYDNSISVLKEINSYSDNFIGTKTKSKLSWVEMKLIKPEYSYEELEELFKSDFINKGVEFNGYTIKNYFPPFEKIRKTKNKIKQTYYKFDII